MILRTPSSAIPRSTRRARIAGLTLVELLVALAIVAVLGILSFRAVAAATDSRQRLSNEFQRWQEITRFLQMAEADMLQMVARPPATADTPHSLIVVEAKGDQGMTFSFLKLDGAHNTVRRVGYRLDGSNIVLLRWPGVDMAAKPAEDAVLGEIKAMRLSFITRDAQRVASWPPLPSATDAVPAAIDFQLESADAGTLQRLIALR